MQSTLCTTPSVCFADSSLPEGAFLIRNFTIKNPSLPTVVPLNQLIVPCKLTKKTDRPKEVSIFKFRFQLKLKGTSYL